jgi:glycosyltransferase involved in cell wall biosynthesis
MRYGGTIVSTRGLCRALVRAGDEVEVLTTPVDGAGDSAVPTDVDVDDHGVRVRYCPSPRLRRFYWSPAMRRALRERAPRASVVHAHAVYLWPTWAASRAARRAARPLVISPRGMLVRSLIEARSRLAKRAWIALVERANLRAAAAIHVTSAHERDALRELGLDLAPRLEVIPNGVDAPAQVVPAPAAGRVLFLGRLSPEKGLDRLLPALAKLPSATLDLVGPDTGGLGESLRAQARSLGIEARVNLRGACAPEDVWSVLGAADVLVLPSASENFGNVVVEAMAAARPVVATRGVGAASALSASAAGLVVDGSPDALADALGRLLDSPAQAAAMGAAGRRHVLAELSWDAVAARMRALYAEIAGAAA